MTTMTQCMRRELANAIRGRYAAAGNKDKRRILEEFVAATGYHEKSAVRVLNTAAARPIVPSMFIRVAMPVAMPPFCRPTSNATVRADAARCARSDCERAIGRARVRRTAAQF